MTALLAAPALGSTPAGMPADAVPAIAVLPRRRPATQTAPQSVGEVMWTPRPHLSLVPSTPTASAVQARYEWTNRGAAVLLVLLLTVLGFVLSTMVSAFLAISDEPPATASVTQTSMASVLAAGR